MSEVALALDLCDRLPCPCVPTGSPGGKQCHSMAAAEYVMFLSCFCCPITYRPSVSAPCCTAVVAQQSSSFLPNLLFQLPTSALASRLCEPKENYVPPVAKVLQLSRRDLAVVLPSPLACFALSGGHHMVFHVLPLNHSYLYWVRGDMQSQVSL